MAVWEGEPLNFSAATTWTAEHTFTVNPYVGVVDDNGNTLLVAPDYTTPGQVTVRFATATAGTLTLIGPIDGLDFVPPPARPGGLGAGPWRNAKLIEIRSAPPVDMNGDIDGIGNLLWAGQAYGYLKRERRTVLVDRITGDIGRASTDVVRDLLWVTDLEGVPVVETPGARWAGSQILVDDLRTATPVRRRFTVKHMEHRAAGLAVDNLRLELDAETVAT